MLANEAGRTVRGLRYALSKAEGHGNWAMPEDDLRARWAEMLPGMKARLRAEVEANAR